MKWQGRTGGGSLGQRLLVAMSGLVDVRVGYAAMAMVVPFYMLFAAKRAGAIYRYLRRRQRYGPWKALLGTYRNHYLFGTAMLDRFAVYAGKGAKIKVLIDGKEHFEMALRSPGGAVIAGSHVGNFELAGYLLPQDQKPINAVIFGGEAATVQAHRVRSFGQSNIRAIPVSQGDMSHIFLISEAIGRGEFVSMPADRVFTGSKVRQTEFLGGKATFPLGAFMIAGKLGVKAMALFAMRIAAMSYRVYIVPLAGDDAAQMQDSYVRSLEKILADYPEQWYNFYEFWDE